jgi:hypothetical protein
MTSKLERLADEHPDWTIRRNAGQDWVCWTAQRAQVITAPVLDELAARLDLADVVTAGDPRVIAAAALPARERDPSRRARSG